MPPLAYEWPWMDYIFHPFPEIHGKQPISIFKAITAKIQQGSASWADLSSALRDLKRHRIPVSGARAALNLADSVNPCPVVVIWDGLTPELVDIDGTAVVVEVGTQNEDEGSIAVALRWNHSSLSPDAAQTFAKQVLALFDVAAADPLQTASTLGRSISPSSRRTTIQRKPVVQPIGWFGRQLSIRTLSCSRNLLQPFFPSPPRHIC